MLQIGDIVCIKRSMPHDCIFGVVHNIREKTKHAFPIGVLCFHMDFVYYYKDCELKKIVVEKQNT